MEERIVCIIGVLDVEGSTNLPMAGSFVKFGWRVLPVNYRTIVNTKGMDYFIGYINHIMNKFNPQLTILCKMNGVPSDIVSLCNQYSTTWLWNPDPIETIKQCPEVIEHAKRANFSSSTGGGVADWFIEQGVENQYHVFCGLDYEVFKPVEPSEEYLADISFIGTKTDERDKYINGLKDIGLNVKAYGSGYDKEVVNSEFTKVCASSKAMLSLNTYNDIPRYFSNRLLRYLGCGTCVFQLDKTETLQEYFTDGKEIVLFKDETELYDKIKGIPEKQLGVIAISGREKALNFLTWDHTVARILQIVGNEQNNICNINS